MGSNEAMLKSPFLPDSVRLEAEKIRDKIQTNPAELDSVEFDDECTKGMFD